VGAATETELKEKKARVEDALHATRAAVEEGIVPAAAWLWFAHPAVDALIKTLEGDEKIGAQIVRRALEEPLRQIVANAGEEGAVVVAKVLESTEPHYGYNAATGVFEDLVKAGVIDPTKVTRTALQNAASIAGLLLTTEALVVEIPEPKSAPAGGGHGGAWTACTRICHPGRRVLLTQKQLKRPPASAGGFLLPSEPYFDQFRRYSGFRIAVPKGIHSSRRDPKERRPRSSADRVYLS